MSLSQISTIYVSVLPFVGLMIAQAFGIYPSLFIQELFFLYALNIYHFISGSQWALSSQTLSTRSKLIPVCFVIAGIIPQVIILHGEFISSAFLLSALYLLQLGYDLSSEIAYCSKRSYKIARVLSTVAIVYSLSYVIS